MVVNDSPVDCQSHRADRSIFSAEKIQDRRFKVSATASVGASVLRTEVSTGHPHPVPATKKTLRSFWSGEFFLIVGVEPVTDVLYTQSPPISNMA